MKYFIVLFLALTLSGCGITGLGLLNTGELKGASAFCLAGEGPPLSGSGVITAARVGEGFHGSTAVGPDCSIIIESNQ